MVLIYLYLGIMKSCVSYIHSNVLIVFLSLLQTVVTMKPDINDGNLHKLQNNLSLVSKP